MTQTSTPRPCRPQERRTRPPVQSRRTGSTGGRAPDRLVPLRTAPHDPERANQGLSLLDDPPLPLRGHYPDEVPTLNGELEWIAATLE